MVWFEDAVAHYGVPIVVFDLYVLVPHIDVTTQILIQHGWNAVSQQHGRIGNETVDSSSQRRLTTRHSPVRLDKACHAESSRRWIKGFTHF